ncbi:MAG TPA: helix-turn-helix domain-containing protein [Gallicola sp.]|nr:helix-turn-helix domain-containing protein [Gallicola sp.]
MKLSEKIKKLRINRNLTQEDIALKLHVSRQTVSKWEQGVNEPSLETLKELAVIFDVKLLELISDETIKPSMIDKYMRRNRILYLLNIFVVMITILIGLILFRGMDDVIPAHYDFLGNITRYGNKIEFLIIPGITFIFLSFSIYFHFVLSKKQEYKKIVFSYQIWMLVLQITILFFTIWLGLKYTSNIENYIFSIITGSSLALVFSVMVFSHPRINERKNTVLGVRTNFTLTNDVAWKKVNTVGSISGSTITLLAYLITLITFKNWNLYLFGFVILSIIPTLIYHELLRKNK